jgi:prevent-host-death family protein
MIQRNVSEAKAELSSLLVKVEEGEEVIIARNGKPVARLVAFEARKEPRKLGSMKGRIWMSEDFDDPDKEVEEMFYGSDEDGVETAA